MHQPTPLLNDPRCLIPPHHQQSTEHKHQETHRRGQDDIYHQSNQEAHHWEIVAIVKQAVEVYKQTSSAASERRKSAMKMKESEDYLTVKFPNPWTGKLSPYIEDEKRVDCIGAETTRVTAITTCAERSAQVVPRKPVGSRFDSTVLSNGSIILGGVIDGLLTSLSAMVKHVCSVVASASSASRTLSDPKVRLDDLFRVWRDWSLAVVYTIVLLYLSYVVCCILAFWLKVGRFVFEGV